MKNDQLEQLKQEMFFEISAEFLKHKTLYTDSTSSTHRYVVVMDKSCSMNFLGIKKGNKKRGAIESVTLNEKINDVCENFLKNLFFNAPCECMTMKLSEDKSKFTSFYIGTTIREWHEKTSVIDSIVADRKFIKKGNSKGDWDDFNNFDFIQTILREFGDLRIYGRVVNGYDFGDKSQIMWGLVGTTSVVGNPTSQNDFYNYKIFVEKIRRTMLFDLSEKTFIKELFGFFHDMYLLSKIDIKEEYMIPICMDLCDANMGLNKLMRDDEKRREVVGIYHSFCRRYFQNNYLPNYLNLFILFAERSYSSTLLIEGDIKKQKYIDSISDDCTKGLKKLMVQINKNKNRLTEYEESVFLDFSEIKELLDSYPTYVERPY
jgi:hypothetical protein